jgi:hypothetical protein
VVQEETIDSASERKVAVGVSKYDIRPSYHEVILRFPRVFRVVICGSVDIMVVPVEGKRQKWLLSIHSGICP